MGRQRKTTENKRDENIVAQEVQGRLRRILYFDDEPFIAESLSRVLELFGNDVTLVSNIGDLCTQLNKYEFDILILDVMAPIPETSNEIFNFNQDDIDEMMDGMNTGVVLAKKIWLLPKYKDIPILFLSARKSPFHDDPEYFNNHKCNYIRKPELGKTINDILIKMAF